MEHLKARLEGGTPAIGVWSLLPSPGAAEILAGAGYDAVMIDLEHGPAGFAEATELVRAVEGRGAAALMRVPANDPVHLKRALDTGIEGVMVPQVSSRAEAEAAVAGCRYPPAGHRGMAATVVRASGYGARWRPYIGEADARLLRICQIETPDAVAAVADIAAVDGVDMLFVGPFDLSANLGYPGEPDHPEVAAAVRRVEQAAKAAGKHLGGITTPQRDAAALLAAGYDFLIPDADVVLLRGAAEGSVAAFRRHTGGGGGEA